VAHRRKVLRHHPDKKAKSGETNDDAFFKCIQKAFEVLSNPERKRQFDSVDPHFIALEQDEPTAADLTASSQAFFDILGPVFEREARFTKNPSAAPLGDIDAPKEVVRHFYDYWYNFDSWRSFEYRDKEVNEGSDSRDDKRYTEKKNKSERGRMKKEDTARVRGLVDLAEKCDPRIKRIKQEEKEAREAKRKAAKPGAGGKPGQPSKVSAAEEAKRKAEEEIAKKEAEEAEEVARAEAKKAKAAAANAAKNARRVARAAEAEGSGTSTPA
jgi:DnaJ homolog subfamily C member 2